MKEVGPKLARRRGVEEAFNMQEGERETYQPIQPALACGCVLVGCDALP